MMILARVGASTCCILMSAMAVFSGGTLAEAGSDSVNVPTLPRERLDDPPASPEFLARQAQSPRMIARRGEFVSVQVNVNAVGNNIVGDAANEPSMAIDPTDPNKMAIGWRQFDTISSNFRQAGVAFSTDGGGSWTFPGVLQPGQFRSDPVLGSDADGNFYYSSLSSLSSIEVFKSIDGGATWSFPPTPAFGGDKQWIAVDDTSSLGSGNVYQIWNVQFSCCGQADLTRSSNGGASFDGPYIMPNPKMKWGTLDVGPDGTLYAAGTTLNQSGHVFGRSLVAQNGAANPTFDLMFEINLGGTVNFATGPNPGGLLGQTWVATDHSSGPTAGNIYVLQSVDPPGFDPLDIHFIRSEDGGFTWSAPVRVNDDPIGTNAWQWFGTMSVAPGGRIDVTWNDTRNSGADNVSELFHSSSLDGGLTWDANVAVSPTFDSFLGWPSQNKMGDYSHMISDDAGASLAYTATFNGEQDVYFLRIPADCSVAALDATDCNANGIADACDIADCPPGDVTCSDCNGNELPDACDVPPLNPLGEDCNGNGVPDECEPDCNGNGVVDTCDCLALVAPQGEALVIDKNRYITFRPIDLGCRTALRVTFVELPPPFDLYTGRSMWVDEPRDVSERGPDVTPTPGVAVFNASTLRCSPLYRDWADADTLHVHHEFIVPGAAYVIQAIDEGCDLADEGVYSAGLAVKTSRWGDVISVCDPVFCAGPFGSLGIDDAISIVLKFTGAPNAPIKARADLEPSNVDHMINVTDILSSISAFVGVSYPFVPDAFPCGE